MCLAIPAKVIEVKKDGKAVVEQPGVKREVLNIINAAPGEFVVLQQGMIVERISEEEARESWRFWSENKGN